MMKQHENQSDQDTNITTEVRHQLYIILNIIMYNKNSVYYLIFLGKS